MSNSLYMLQTHCVKYQINTFWCQIDRRSCKQALLLFIETKCPHSFTLFRDDETQVIRFQHHHRLKCTKENGEGCCYIDGTGLASGLADGASDGATETTMKLQCLKSTLQIKHD